MQQCFLTAQATRSIKTGKRKLLRNGNNKNSPWFNSLPNYSDCAKYPLSVNKKFLQMSANYYKADIQINYTRRQLSHSDL